jgi:hypothetical protein
MGRLGEMRVNGRSSLKAVLSPLLRASQPRRKQGRQGTWLRGQSWAQVTGIPSASPAGEHGVVAHHVFLRPICEVLLLHMSTLAVMMMIQHLSRIGLKMLSIPPA